jgi:hypothetical protein
MIDELRRLEDQDNPMAAKTTLLAFMGWYTYAITLC